MLRATFAAWYQLPFVIAAQDGLEAQTICSQSNGQIDLVLSDLIMPSISGEELHSWLKEHKPKLKMVAVTGYPLEEGGKTLLKKGIVAWIQKPFTADILAKVVAEALAEQGDKSLAESLANARI